MVYSSHISKPKIYGLFYRVCSCASLVVILFGLIFSLVSAGVLGLWVGLEINFLGAVCFIRGFYVEETERVIKYFIIQVVGSCFLLLGFLIIVFHRFPFLIELFLILGLTVKLGIFPFHFWIPGVISSLSWYACFTVSTIQKLVPLWFLSNLVLRVGIVNVIEILAIITSFAGCVGGLGILNYRALIGYSSLVHLGFLLITCLVESNLLWIYFLIYRLLNLGVMWSLWSISVYCYSDFILRGDISFYSGLWWVALYFISLAGIPPFRGVFLKVYFIVNCWDFIPLGCVLCIISSVVRIYFYLGVVIELIVYKGKGVWNERKRVVNLGKIKFVRVVINIVLRYPLFLICGA